MTLSWLSFIDVRLDLWISINAFEKRCSYQIYFALCDLQDLQEVAGVAVSAFQKAGVSLLGQETGDVAWHLNIEAVQDGQDQLRPAGGDHTKNTTLE